MGCAQAARDTRTGVVAHVNSSCLPAASHARATFFFHVREGWGMASTAGQGWDGDLLLVMLCGD